VEAGGTRLVVAVHRVNLVTWKGKKRAAHVQAQTRMGCEEHGAADAGNRERRVTYGLRP